MATADRPTDIDADTQPPADRIAGAVVDPWIGGDLVTFDEYQWLKGTIRSSIAAAVEDA